MKNIILIYLIFLSHIQYSQTELLGITTSGGIDNKGVLFSYSLDSFNIKSEHQFAISYPGQNPIYTNLCEGFNGKFYGMTNLGGNFGMGILFEYDSSNNSYQKKIDFSGVLNGNGPQGGLLLSQNGKLYGMTSSGGLNGFGVLFEYDPVTNVFNKKIDFNGALNGSTPLGNLIEASNGKLYGMTSLGGANGKGVLFEFDVNSGILSKKIDFSGISNGSSPRGSLVQVSNSKLYGMTSSGGTNDLGLVFEYDILANILTPKVIFNGANGSAPFGNLVLGSNNSLFGITNGGGSNYSGVLFEYNFTSNFFLKKIDFNSINGINPQGSLVRALNGKLYGMTYKGGANNLGVLFEYDPLSGIYLKKNDFSGINDGSGPRGTLLQGSNGKIYGMTYSGGICNFGVLFEFNPTSGTLVKKIDFDIARGGAYPSGRLVKASNGNLYGVTNSGGEYNSGIIFEYNLLNNSFAKKIDFNNSITGKNPQAGLIEATNGKLYGVTSSGGINGLGVLYEYNPLSNIFIKKKDFNSIDGGSPNGELMQASNGKLYGTTVVGGINDKGVLYEYDVINNIYLKLFEFDGMANGQNPQGGLVEVNGKLYGMTSAGGSASSGVLFEFDINTQVFSKKIDFTGTSNGRNPYGTLLLTQNSKLLGLTYSGGINNLGVLFEYDYNLNSCSKKIDFSGLSNGANPYGTLIESSNGKIYGVTYKGGTNNIGILFEYDYLSNILSKKIDFNGTNGAIPMFTKLLEVSKKSSLNFDGIDDYVSIPYAEKNTNVTHEFWFRTNEPDQGLFSVRSEKNDSIKYDRDLYMQNGNLYAYIMDSLSGEIISTSGLNFADGNWHHIAHTFGSQEGGQKLFVDGILRSSGLVSVSKYKLSDSIYIGFSEMSSVNKYFKGDIDEFRLWDTIRTQCEINMFRNCEIDSVCNVLKVNLLFNKLFGRVIEENNIVMDVSGNLNSGFLNSFMLSGNVSNWIVPGAVKTGYFSPMMYNILATASNTSICFGDSLKLVGYGVGDFSWSSGINDDENFVPLNSSTYTVTGIDTLTGCSSSDQIFIEVLDLPNISVNSGSVCLGNSYTFTPTGGLNYSFSSGSSVVTPSISCNYTVTGTNAVGCKNYAVASLTVLNNPLPVVSVNSGSVCEGQAFLFSPIGADIYLYSSGTDTVYPMSDTTYLITGVNQYGCYSSVTSSISVFPLPLITIASSNSLICSGETLTLSVSGASSYTWSTLENTTEIVVTPSTTTVYSVTGTDTNGCSNQAIINQNVDLCTSLKIHSLLKNTLIYPSPTTGNLWIELNYQTSITIINSLGETIFNMEMLQGKNELKLSDQPNGVYYLKLKHNNNQEIFKVVKVN